MTNWRNGHEEVRSSHKCLDAVNQTCLHVKVEEDMQKSYKSNQTVYIHTVVNKLMLKSSLDSFLSYYWLLSKMFTFFHLPKDKDDSILTIDST